MKKNQYNFENRTALITGGAQGFGLDITKRFLDSGAKVVIWDIDNKVLDKTKKDVNNVNLISDIVDVSVYKDVEKAASKILSNSKIDNDTLDELLKHDLWLNATMCKKLGLVDIII